MKILICEDELMTQKAIEFKLKSQAGLELTLASDGKQGMELAASGDFDLIITDLLMPYASGLELITYVRNTLQKSTPIIVLTKLGEEEILMQAFELGADDYITKPFSPVELSIRVNRQIKIK